MIILGSGTCVPSLKRSAPAYYLEEEGRQVLIDCGGGTVLQLEKSGRSYKDIDAVFITHSHPDHVAGIMPLIHALVATPLFKREKGLLLAGPKNLKKFYENCIIPVTGSPKTFSIQIQEIEDKMDYPPFRIFTANTVHSENSLAFRFECGSKSVVITGDADYGPELVELSKKCDILIADCSFTDNMKTSGHMTPKECGLIAREAGVKKLLLSHLHSLPFPNSDRIKQCRQVFNGDVSLAEDLLEFNL
ncbi:MAG: ribonuclease Z [Candidatus Mariimomonas ferrooxydans]